ncbi:uncharacterized protein [Mytilus edulis]|uniref:uncharacterized protein n=1 Tax=Mytilus edulis TaxID=6550 RepID=UPI0039EF4408
MTIKQSVLPCPSQVSIGADSSIEKYAYNLYIKMIMTHICTCVLFVLMCGTSDAASTATLPTGYHTGVTITPCVKYSRRLCMDPNYNPLTGIYTVTMNGTYLVSVTMMTGIYAGHCRLTKNKVNYVWLYTGNQYDMATQTVCMDLVVGNQISVVTSAPALFDVYNTFTVVKVMDQ